MGRFIFVIPLLAVAGSLAQKKLLAPSAGTFPTHRPLFVGLLVGVVLIIGGLTYFPAVSLGPGYATQIGREQIMYALTTLGANRILALCNPENKASRHVLEVKLGMTSMPQIDVPGRGLRNVYVATRETLDLWSKPPQARV